MLKNLFCLFVTAIAAVSAAELPHVIEKSVGNETFRVAFPSEETTDNYDSWEVYYAWPDNDISNAEFEVTYPEDPSLYQEHNFYEKARIAAASNTFDSFLLKSMPILNGPLNRSVKLPEMSIELRNDCVVATETHYWVFSNKYSIRRYIFTPMTVYRLEILDAPKGDVDAFLDSFELIKN